MANSNDGFVSSLESIFVNGASRYVSGRLDNRFAPAAPPPSVPSSGYVSVAGRAHWSYAAAAALLVAAVLYLRK